MTTKGHALLSGLEQAYSDLSGTRRSVRAEDRLQEDLDIDSLLGMELLVTLEERFGVELVGDPRTAELRTVGDLLSLLHDRGAEASADG